MMERACRCKTPSRPCGSPDKTMTGSCPGRHRHGRPDVSGPTWAALPTAPPTGPPTGPPGWPRPREVTMSDILDSLADPTRAHDAARLARERLHHGDIDEAERVVRFA